MPIWKNSDTIEDIMDRCRDTLVSHLGISFTEIGDDYICATMPVDSRTMQPYGLLHGGASVVLAETLGSVAARLAINNETSYAVGQEINANHLRSATSGHVTGTVRPLHIGKKSHVWDIQIEDEDNRLICVSRITMSILNR